MWFLEAVYTLSMPIRVAIPEPSSSDAEYNSRSLPSYCEALRLAGAEPVVIRYVSPKEEIDRLLAESQGILLPGSRFDVEPERYGEARIPECGEADPARSEMDGILLAHAFRLRKPILAICHGMQSMNVWAGGKLVQHLTTSINHSPGRTIGEAHAVEIAPGSNLAAIAQKSSAVDVKVNSSHHQAVRIAGDRFRVTARCPGDDVIEAIELDDVTHFVVGVQWHPERTYAESALSREIFSEFVRAVGGWQAAVGKDLAR
jgi:putative glutamine amidotransferase